MQGFPGEGEQSRQARQVPAGRANRTRAARPVTAPSRRYPSRRSQQVASAVFACARD